MPPLLYLKDTHLTFGTTRLLDGAELAVGEGERLALVGRNGSGKSTLLKIAAGLVDADSGTRFVQPGATVRYLPQEPSLEGYATTRDYVEAAWLMLQQDKPDDYVIASGEQYSVRDFVNAAAGELGLKLRWSGKGLKEIARIEHNAGGKKTSPKNGQVIVRVDPRYFRPTEVETLLGDARKARRKLGWRPRVKFGELVAEMVREDLRAAERDELVKRHGYAAYDFHE